MAFPQRQKIFPPEPNEIRNAPDNEHRTGFCWITPTPARRRSASFGFGQCKQCAPLSNERRTRPLRPPPTGLVSSLVAAAARLEAQLGPLGPSNYPRASRLLGPAVALVAGAA